MQQNRGESGKRGERISPPKDRGGRSRPYALHLEAPKTAQEKTVLQRQIDTTDRWIDGLVYELYGLSEEEIGIV